MQRQRQRQERVSSIRKNNTVRRKDKDCEVTHHCTERWTRRSWTRSSWERRRTTGRGWGRRRSGGRCLVRPCILGSRTTNHGSPIKRTSRRSWVRTRGAECLGAKRWASSGRGLRGWRRRLLQSVDIDFSDRRIVGPYRGDRLEFSWLFVVGRVSGTGRGFHTRHD